MKQESKQSLSANKQSLSTNKQSLSANKKISSISKIAKRLSWLGAFSLLTALLWVALDGYHQLVKQERFERLNELTEQLNPDLNTEILEEVRSRKEYKLEEVEEYFLPMPTVAEIEEEESVSSPSGTSTTSGELE